MDKLDLGLSIFDFKGSWEAQGPELNGLEKLYIKLLLCCLVGAATLEDTFPSA
jgi:hypothetical protein